MYKCPQCEKVYKNKAAAIACPICHPENEQTEKQEQKPGIEKTESKQEEQKTEKNEIEKIIDEVKEEVDNTDSTTEKISKSPVFGLEPILVFCFLLMIAIFIFFRDEIMKKIWGEQK